MPPILIGGPLQQRHRGSAPHKNLTRRANQRHKAFIIARISKARAGKLAAGFFNRTS